MSRIEKYLPSYCYSTSMMQSINGIVIHYFSGKYQFPDDPLNANKCYNLFKDLNRPARKREHYKMIDVTKRMYASAHFMIARDGTIMDLVPLPHKAWHAGKSEWQDKKYCNNWMVGIEMVATHDSGYTDEQYDALVELTVELIAKYDIPWDNITGHENVAPGRKKDPGPNFDWDRYRNLETTETESFVDQLGDMFDDINEDWFGSD